MNRKFSSIMVILCTLFSVVFMLFSNQPVKQNVIQASDKMNKSGILSGLFNHDEPIEKKEKQVSKRSVYQAIESQGTSIAVLPTGKFKKNKMNSLYENYESDLQAYYDSKYGSPDTKQSVQQSEPIEEPEAPVYNPSVGYEFSETDKKNLLAFADELSPIDYARISDYLHSENKRKGIEEAIDLMRDRMSEKEFESVELFLQKLGKEAEKVGNEEEQDLEESVKDQGEKGDRKAAEDEK
jgi:hypothetical protein